jgi:hypothetical protein
MSPIYVGRLSRAARREAPLIALFLESHAALGATSALSAMYSVSHNFSKKFRLHPDPDPDFFSAHFELI